MRGLGRLRGAGLVGMNTAAADGICSTIAIGSTMTLGRPGPTARN